MEFRILGQLEAVDGSRSRPIGGPRQRTLLADLLLHANSVVPSDRLIDDLWGDEPPSSGLHALRVEVSRLRKTLEGSAACLESVASGYVLRIGAEDLDLIRFERLASKGRRALTEGRLSAASDLLDRALAQWRAECLAGGSAARFLEPHRVRLEELRLSALEDRIEANLALGRHADVVADLRSLVAEHPLRERLRAQLMLALYRCDRQGDALNEYHEARRVLAEELGIDPGPALQELARAILRRGPDLEAPAFPELVSGDAGPLGFAPKPGGGQEPRSESRKVVTVLFVDVQVSSRDSLAVDPERERAITRAALVEIRRVLEHFGGSPIGWAGTSLMVVFGVPLVHEDDAFRAVRAAAELRHVPERLGAKLPQPLVILRVGVSTGEVLASPSGNVSGDPVPSATVLQRAAAPGDVMLDATTQSLVKDALTCEPVELATADAPRAIAYRLLDVVPGVRRPVTGLRSPFVGRRREAATLERTLRSCQGQRSCALVTVLGPPGIGKTRLVEEFVRRIEGRARLLVGACLPYGDGMTLWPLGAMVRQAAHVTDGDDAGSSRRKLEALLEGTDDAAAVVERIAWLMGASDLEVGEGETTWAVRRLFEALAAKRPLVAIVEDLHWAQPGLLDLLDGLARWSRGTPMQIVCTARPEFVEGRPGWGAGIPSSATVELTALSRGEAGRLVANLLGVSQPPAAVTPQVLHAADGNPLFVEQTLAMLIEHGAIRHDDGTWVLVDDRDDVTIPATVQALLTARLERLPRLQRDLLQRASVIGEVFYLDAVRAMGPGDDEQLDDAFDALVGAKLLAPTSSDLRGERAFGFGHALVCDVAYASLPKSHRADLHERFAGWLERAHPERLRDVGELAGSHLDRACCYLRELDPGDERAGELALAAAERLLSAGGRAMARFDFSSAERLLGRADALLAEKDPRRPEMLIHLGRVLLSRADLGRAREVFERAVSSAGDAGRADLQGRAALGRAEADAFLGSGEDPLREAAARWIPVFEALEDHRGLTEAHHALGLAATFPVRFSEAARHDHLAVYHARLTGDHAEESCAIERWLGHALLGREPRSAIARTLDEYRQLVGKDAPWARRWIVHVRGRLAEMTGDVEEGRRLLHEALALCEELGDVDKAKTLRFQLAWLEEAVEGWAAAATELSRGLELARIGGDVGTASTFTAELALVSALAGRVDEASHLADEAERSSSPGDLVNAFLIRQVRALVLLASGQAAPAVAMAREAVEMTDRTDCLHDQGNSRLVLARVLEADGNIDAAAEAIRQAAARFDEKEDALRAGRARALLQRLVAQRRTLDHADESG